MTSARSQPAMLEVERLSVVYDAPRAVRRSSGPSRPAVDDVSLHVERGEVVGLVGESGSGKSTVALAILGLVRAQDGSVRLDGTEIVGLKGAALSDARLGFQMVFQDPYGSLDPRQRIGAGFNEVRRYHRERTAWATDEEVLDLVRLEPSTLQRFPHQLSGGQIQRVVIARSLLLRPKLLIADEPTSALDVSVQAQILSLLRELRDTLGLAVLFISHDLGVVRNLTSRVYVMRSGRIVESGATEDVLGGPQHEYTRTLLAAMPGRGLATADQPGAPTDPGAVA